LIHRGSRLCALRSVCSWLVVILCMLIIYQLSSQSATTSDSVSKGIVKYGVETGIKLTKAEVTELEKWSIIDKIDSIGREYMHGVVFLLLGLFVQNAIQEMGTHLNSVTVPRNRSLFKGIRAIAISLAICIIYAISDEIHQLFIPGRAFQLSDLAMDTIGSIIGIILVFAVFREKEYR